MCWNADHDSDAVNSRVLYVIYLWQLNQNNALVRCKLHVCLYCCFRIHSESKDWKFVYLVSTIDQTVFIS